MRDPFKLYMNTAPEIEFHDQPIPAFTRDALSPFCDENGCFTKSFDVTVRDIEKFSEVTIISTIAKYESDNDDIPAMQIRIIDAAGTTIYYSPVYEVGHKREFYRREWRIPMIIDRFDTVRFSFIIPEGVRLYIRTAQVKHNYGFRERDFGIRYHGHGGFTSAFGIQLTAELGYTSCITVPKFTKDGIGVCVHDDATVVKELRLDDGSIAEPGSKYDKPVSEFTYEELQELNVWRNRSDIFTGMRVPTLEEYFRICSSTGMQPIFSVHPQLTKEQWLIVRELLIKYRLLNQFYVKSNEIPTHQTCLEVFGTDIAGYIVIYGARDKMHPIDFTNAMGFDRSKHNIIIEYFDHIVTEEMMKNARDAGFDLSIACMRGGVTGQRMQYLIDNGVTEFTLDHHCSMGLSW